MGDILRQLDIIFQKKRRYVFVFLIALLIFVLVRSIPNFPFLKIFSRQYGVFSYEFLDIFGSYLLGTFFSTTIADSVVLVVLGILTGINIVVFGAFIRRQKNLLASRGGALSVTGMLLGLVGAGCASCGTALLAPVLTALGLVGSLSWLPFHGLEISFIGLGLVIFSTWFVLRKMSQPTVCDIS
jgi:hypothetical protein